MQRFIVYLRPDDTPNEAMAYAYWNDSPLIAEYRETNEKHRTQLKKALEHCKQARATLLIARLDRLAISPTFLEILHQSGVAFIALDNPHVTRLFLPALLGVANCLFRKQREQVRDEKGRMT